MLHTRPSAGPTIRAIRRALLVAALLAAASLPGPVRAQTLETMAGAVMGAAGGTLVSVAVVAAGARAGRFLYAPSDATWALLPVSLGGVAGGILGHRSPERLWRSAGWGAAGLAAGSLTGAAAGHLLHRTSRDAWFGAVLGGAAGLVAGSLVGALTWEGEEGPPVRASFRIPLGP